MRLLIATDAFPPKCGGSGWSAFYLARALQARGHQVEIVQPKAGLRGTNTRAYGDLSVTEFGYAVSNLPGVRARQRRAVLEGEFAAFLAQRARNKEVIHAQHLLTIPAAVVAGRAAQVPVVSTVRDYWPVCLYGTLWREGEMCPVCRGGELTRCLRQKYGAAAALLRPLVPLVEKELAERQRALRASGAVIAVSSFVAQELRGVVEEARLCVVPNLIDIQETRRLAELDRSKPDAPRFLLFIGKLNEMKGADRLPEILRRAGVNLPLVVVGEGPLAARLGSTPGVEVRGWLSNREALQLLARATALLFPSRWAEPLARVLLEAQALGAPTVALDTGGTRDIIQDGVNGLLARDIEGFARQLATLVDDDARRQDLSRAARRVAEDRFSSRAVAPQVEAVYQRAAT